MPEPPPALAPAPPDRIIGTFVATLRAAGLEVPLGAVLSFALALGEVGLADRGPVYWAGRATLLRRPEDREIYDRVFAEFFDRRRASRFSTRPASLTVALDAAEADEAGGADQDGEQSAEPTLVVRYSAAEVLRNQDFAAYSEADWAEARRLVARLRLSADLRRSRRPRPSKSRHGTPDLARTVRRALASDGEPLVRAWRSPSNRPRRVVYLVDISGSMQAYARAFLRLAHAAVASRPVGAVEVFALGTRLTRITRQLSWRDPDAALADAGRLVEDWYGGTRLGDGLRSFNDRWGTRGMARGAVVVILSDGWDRGDPGELAGEMARLRRIAHRIIWVNPLKASPGYAPIARGMAAALPFVDDFVEGHSLASLEALADTLERSGRTGSRAAATGRPGDGSGSARGHGLHSEAPAR